MYAGVCAWGDDSTCVRVGKGRLVYPRMDAGRGGLSGFGTGPRALSGEACRSMQKSVHEEIIARAFAGIKDGLAIHEGH